MSANWTVCVIDHYDGFAVRYLTGTHDSWPEAADAAQEMHATLKEYGFEDRAHVVVKPLVSPLAVVRGISEDREMRG